MRGKVDIVTYMMTMLVVRREGVVRERKVVIDEERIMRRHHNTPKLAREDAGNRRSTHKFIIQFSVPNA